MHIRIYRDLVKNQSPVTNIHIKTLLNYLPLNRTRSPLHFQSVICPILFQSVICRDRADKRNIKGLPGFRETRMRFDCPASASMSFRGCSSLVPVLPLVTSTRFFAFTGVMEEWCIFISGLRNLGSDFGEEILMHLRPS